MVLRLFALIIFLLSALFRAREASCAESRKPTEYDVKAAFIYNFAKFVEWPPRKFQDGGAVLNVCVAGENPFGPALEALEGKVVGGRKIKLRQNPLQQNMGSCAILFISDSEDGQLGRILETVASAGVLTIGDTKGFAQKGVMINFFMEDNKVRFEISQKAAERAGLKISSNLLKLARIVGTP